LHPSRRKPTGLTGAILFFYSVILLLHRAESKLKATVKSNSKLEFLHLGDNEFRMCEEYRKYVNPHHPLFLLPTPIFMYQ
jgi:hypothetical protein